MSDRLMDEFLESYKGTNFPEAFLQDYEILECLASHNQWETLLVSQRKTGRLCIAKCCADATLFAASSEGEILKSLRHEGLPEYLGEYRSETMCCSLREYIPGKNLAVLADEAPLSEKLAISVCCQLCDILTYLHSQHPPVIHRDIKPQNIIADEKGTIKLIDFGISRTYNENARRDTVFFGTQEFAPPEQYGFSQTDGRTDIYSLGILLCFLLTGGTDPGKEALPNRRLAAVIKKCTSFSPEDRYSDAAAVKKALLRAENGKRTGPRYLLYGATALLALCLGLGLGWSALEQRAGSEVKSPPSNAVTFTDPLIEKAVRLELGKDPSETLTQEELLTVTEIYIFGSEVSTSSDEFNEGLSGARADSPRGTITSLADVKLLPNLKVLYVNYQQLSDISPLAELHSLERVDLRHTHVSDVSALSGMQYLRELSLFDTGVSDISCLQDCPRLASVELGDTLIRSLSSLAGYETATYLSLRKLSLSSLDGIEEFSHLTTLCLTGTGLGDLTPLLAIPTLENVVIDESMRSAAEAIAGQIKFSITYE